jgi:2-iminoacetate synthase
MDLAKPGEIKNHCSPNALSSFMEYLNNYASPETVEAGTRLIEETIAGMTGIPAQRARKLVDRVKAGQKDVFC